MLTKCPECNATFRVSNEQLEIAEGLVRCGLCDTVFNGSENAYEENGAKPTVEAEDIEQTQDEIENELGSGANLESEYSNEVQEDNLEDVSDIPPVIIDDVSAPPNNTHDNLRNMLWTFGSIALVIFLLGQITYWSKVELLPQGWIDKACNLFGCNTSIKRDISAIKMLNRNIYTHPNVEDALMITTTIVNESEITQPFPKLQVALMDVQGEVIAIRLFTPEQYLVNKALLDTLMPPDKPVGARLEVLDPGSNVIAYEFKFY